MVSIKLGKKSPSGSERTGAVTLATVAFCEGAWSIRSDVEEARGLRSALTAVTA